MQHLLQDFLQVPLAVYSTWQANPVVGYWDQQECVLLGLSDCQLPEPGQAVAARQPQAGTVQRCHLHDKRMTGVRPVGS